MDSPPNNVTVIVMEDETSERLLEATCGKHHEILDKRKKSLWKRLFRGSERSARSLGSRTAATSGSSSNPARYSVRNLSSSSHDSVLSCDDEDDNNYVFSANLSFLALSEQNDAELPQQDCMDCAEICECNSFSTELAEQDEPSIAELNDVHQPLDVLALLEESQAARVAGDYGRALDLYERVLSLEHNLQLTLIQMANLCYACTRLAFQLHDYHAALHYAERELGYTLQICQGRPTMAVSKCYHELARISRVGLGESDSALKFYKKALRIEHQVYESITAQGTTVRTTPAQEVLQHIQETKGCIGRILFEKGNVEEALWML